MASPPEGSLLLRGTGPVATVYVMPRPGGGRVAAAKVYPGPLDRTTLAELAEEQRVLAGVRTVSSILLIEDVETLPDGRAAIRMELCAQSLAEWVEANGPLPTGAVSSMAQTLAAVLRDAHEAGIVHGGVTPTNVLLRSAGQPVLADFGLGLRQRFPRPPEAAAAYTAPEVLRGAEPDERADLYGLGATLHLCLTGRPPFSARTGEPAGEILLRALGEPPPTVTGEGVPPGLSALVSALLAKRPGDRPADAGAVLDHLDSTGRRPGRRRADVPVEFDDFSEDFAAPGRTSAPPPPPERPPRRSHPESWWQQAETPVRSVPDDAADEPLDDDWADLEAEPATAEPKPPETTPDPARIVTVAAAVPRRVRTDRRPQASWLLAAAAVIAVVGLFVVLGLGGEGSGDSSGAPTNPATSPVDTPASATPAPTVRLEIDQLVDSGTSVRLTWRSTKPLTYAVFVAEQGRSTASARYRGSGRSLVVPVRPELKYCFLIQGTDGSATFESLPRAIRGATCKN